MSIENIRAFREAANSSEKLQQRILAGDDLVALARSEGYEFSHQELQRYDELESDGELSEFELEIVSGGQDKNTSS